MVGRTHRSQPRTRQMITRFFGPLVEAMEFVCLDIGARGGATLDVEPLAGSCRIIGFEPDAAECERLNADVAAGGHPWARLDYVPVALGRATAEPRPLNLYAKAGCTSLLEGDRVVAAQFRREHYFRLEGTESLITIPLDQAAVEHGFERADYLKIDIQGAELEVFETGRRLLAEHVLAIRTEVSFLPLYHGQPLFADVDACLRQHGFWPALFAEIQHWRRETLEKPHRLADGDFPYSRGELAHADVVFFRNIGTMPTESEADQDRLIRLALLALCYDLVDLAVAAFRLPAVRARAEALLGRDPVVAAADHSRALARYRRKSPFSRGVVHP